MLNPIVAQAQLNVALGNILVVTISFLLLMLLLKKYAWGPLSEVLKQREDKIANDIDSAEASKIAAAKLEKERQQQLLSSKTEAADIIKSAKENGEVSRQALLNETQEEILRLKEKASNDIQMEREAALGSVKDEVATLSLDIASKILEQELSGATHESLIDQYIEDLGNYDETR